MLISRETEVAALRADIARQVQTMLTTQREGNRPLEVGLAGFTVARVRHGGVQIKGASAELHDAQDVAQLVGLLEGSMGFMTAFAQESPDLVLWEGEAG